VLACSAAFATARLRPVLVLASRDLCSASSLRELRDRLQTEFRVDLAHLSMGMTQDFPIAVEEGATLVRVGTAIFGERSKLKKDLATDEH
jgi:hypothetical protein